MRGDGRKGEEMDWQGKKEEQEGKRVRGGGVRVVESTGKW